MVSSRSSRSSISPTPGKDDAAERVRYEGGGGALGHIPVADTPEPGRLRGGDGGGGGYGGFDFGDLGAHSLGSSCDLLDSLLHLQDGGVVALGAGSEFLDGGDEADDKLV